MHASPPSVDASTAGFRRCLRDSVRRETSWEAALRVTTLRKKATYRENLRTKTNARPGLLSAHTALIHLAKNTNQLTTPSIERFSQLFTSGNSRAGRRQKS